MTICTPLIVNPENYLHSLNFLLLRHSFLRNKKKSQILLYPAQNSFLNSESLNAYILDFSTTHVKQNLQIFVSNMLSLRQRMTQVSDSQKPGFQSRTLPLLHLLLHQLVLCISLILLQSIYLSYFYCHYFNFELIIFGNFLLQHSITFLTYPRCHQSSLNCQFSYSDTFHSFGFISGFRHS